MVSNPELVVSNVVDLRSDTVTRPSPAMREAMASADVGDDVFGEDPTVKDLEALVAEVLGKEAALFVPSGVMGNQLAIMVHTNPGDEVILAERSHIFHYESGAPARLSGVQLNPIPQEQGLLTPELVGAAVRGGHDWEPRTRLLCLENTVNKSGGVVYPADMAASVAARGRELGLRVHLDGARLWNAALAQRVSESTLSEPFDTVSVCLSKGLGAPVGSMLAGTTEAIRLARRYRKLLGGGMRQVGILAAAGLFAIEHNREKLRHDHARARKLAEAMAKSRVFNLDPAAVQTNIVIAETIDRTAASVLSELEQNGVRMVAFGPTTIRATTHLDISDSDIEHSIRVIAAM